MRRCAGPWAWSWLLASAVCVAQPTKPLAQTPTEQAAALLAQGEVAQGLQQIEAEVLQLEQQGRAQEALRKLQTLALLKDELRRLERQRASAALQARIAGEQQSQEIARLRLIAERGQAELATRQARQQLYVLSGLTALLACVILLQWLMRAPPPAPAQRRPRAAAGQQRQGRADRRLQPPPCRGLAAKAGRGTSWQRRPAAARCRPLQAHQ